MAYTPDPTDVAQPVDSVFASTAAAEFRALKAYLATVVAGGGPGAQTPGMIADFAFLTAPPGWLHADGSLVSRTTYAALWALATTDAVSEVVWSAGAFGRFSVGDGSTTFRLPDFRSMIRKGSDSGRGYGSSAVGQFVNPYSSHYHGTSFGWDGGTSLFTWNDGSGNPVFGSDVGSVGGSIVSSKVAGNTTFTGRFARTNSETLAAGDNLIPANNGVLTCIKT